MENQRLRHENNDLQASEQALLDVRSSGRWSMNVVGGLLLMRLNLILTITG